MDYYSVNLLNNSTIRLNAREKLRGNWAELVLAFFIYTIIVSIISVIQLADNYFVNTVIYPLLTIVIVSPLALGLYILFLRFHDSGTANINYLFKGFNNIGKAIGLNIVMGIFVFLWSLLLIIPGIIAAIRYSQAMIILAENPDIGIMEAINRSKEIMAGVKAKYFFLQLSFLGWALLCLLTLGIGYLWLSPYMYTSYIIFYKDIIKHHTNDENIEVIESN